MSIAIHAPHIGSLTRGARPAVSRPNTPAEQLRNARALARHVVLGVAGIAVVAYLAVAAGLIG